MLFATSDSRVSRVAKKWPLGAQLQQCIVSLLPHRQQVVPGPRRGIDQLVDLRQRNLAGVHIEAEGAGLGRGAVYRETCRAGSIGAINE